MPLPSRLDLCHAHSRGLPGLRGTFPAQPERGDADEVGPHLLGSLLPGQHGGTPRLPLGDLVPGKPLWPLEGDG